MRKIRVKWLKEKFLAIYASASEEAKQQGYDLLVELPRATAWRIFKKQYLANRHG